MTHYTLRDVCWRDVPAKHTLQEEKTKYRNENIYHFTWSSIHKMLKNIRLPYFMVTSLTFVDSDMGVVTAMGKEDFSLKHFIVSNIYKHRFNS